MPHIKGVKFSAESRRKMSLAKMGHAVSKATREKISKHLPDVHGSKNSNWKGGITTDKKHINFLRGRHYQMKKINNGYHTLEEWDTLKAQYNWTCPSCGRKEPKIKLTEDHIIPKSRGGSSNIENIQPLCQGCNSKKAEKIIDFRERRVYA